MRKITKSDTIVAHLFDSIPPRERRAAGEPIPFPAPGTVKKVILTAKYAKVCAKVTKTNYWY